MAEKPRKKLTRQQQAFIEHYLMIGGAGRWNGAKAARLAGYSEKSAKRAASVLLSDPLISKAIDDRLKEMRMSANEVIARLVEQAVAPWGESIIKGGRPDVAALDEAGYGRFVKRVKYKSYSTEGGGGEEVEVEMVDSQAALIHLGRNLKLFTDKVEATGKDGLPLVDAEQIAAAALDRLRGVGSNA